MAYRLRYEIISISCGFCLYLTTSPWVRVWAHTVTVLKLMSVLRGYLGQFCPIHTSYD